MQINNDGKGNIYVEIENLRITYVEQRNRLNVKDWPNSDVLRIQAYQGNNSKSLHKGAELPIYNEKSIYGLFEAISHLLMNK